MLKRDLLIPFTLVVALVVQIIPLPVQLDIYRPDWVLMVLAYWTMALPHRVNVGVAFFTGIVMDILLGTPLGVHSLVLCLCVYVLAANYQRLRNYSVWQQCIIIGLLGAFYHLLLFWLLHLLNQIFFQYAYMFPVFSTMLIWPWVFWLLRKLRRELKVA